MENKKFFDIFFDDSEKYISDISEWIVRFLKDRTKRALLNDILREVHSIKSEAAYLSLDDVAKFAHGLEDDLDRLRKDKKGGGSGEFAKLSEKIKELFEMIENIRIKGLPGKKGSEEKKSALPSETDDCAQPAIGASCADSIGSTGKIPPACSRRSLDIPRMGIFSGFEMKLAEEAEEREEQIYKAVFKISESSVMKYPRSYLILNNLELKTNVIKLMPEMEIIERGDVSEISVVFSSSLSADDIANSSYVDELESISLSELYFDRAGRKSCEKERTPFDSLRMDLSDFEKIISDTEEMRLLFAEKKEREGSRFEDLLRSVKKDLDELRVIDIESGYSAVKKMAARQAESLGKEAEVVFETNGLKIDKAVLDYLYDPLVHIVKNSVDHGIETPEERRAAGKPPVGKIVISSERRGKELSVSVKDDGRGIDTDMIRKKAGLGDEELSDGRILDIISADGFSTKDDAGIFSGRGAGMAAASKNIFRLDGAAMKLETEKGRGTEISVTLPDIFIPADLVEVLWNGMILCFDRFAVKEAKRADKAAFALKKYSLFYEGMPVYDFNGKIYRDVVPEKESLILIVSGREGDICFIADALLDSRIVPKNSFAPLPTCCRNIFLLETGKEMDVCYLKF